jgi:hypothetical protein
MFLRLRRRYRTICEWIERKLTTVNEAPIFVLGNQKSGTTAIAVLLAERAGLSVEYDLTIGHGALVADIHQGRESLEALVEQNRLEFSREVVKDPNFTFLYKPLRERFPDAKYVMVMRDPRDNIRSILDRLNLPGGNTALKRSQYDEMTFGWKMVVDGSWMGIEDGNYIDRLAERWNRAAHMYLGNQNNIELIRYEDFIQRKVAAIDNLVSRLGEKKENQIEGKVDQQFQPRGHRRDVSWSSFFGKSNLKRIEKRCAKAMNAIGYGDYRTLEREHTS